MPRHLLESTHRQQRVADARTYLSNLKPSIPEHLPTQVPGLQDMDIQMPVIDQPSECQVCRGLLDMFAATQGSLPATEHVHLGSFEDALATNCQRHKPLLEAYRDYCSRQPGYHDLLQRSRPYYAVIFFRAGSPHLLLHQPSSTRGMEVSRTLLLIDKPSLRRNSVRKGCVLDPEYMDLAVPKHWLHQCLTSHGTTCQNPARIRHTRPAWLVDVQQMCIVSGHDSDSAIASSSFVALSYRWGSLPGVRILRESLHKLQQPGILNSNPHADEDWVSPLMTPMVRHAIHLTSALGERYLWVDTLCIVHGEPDTLEQLHLMGFIYASATVVIVAADGDAQTGIAGLRAVHASRPREAQQPFAPFGDDATIILGRGQHFSHLAGTPYYKRGWTYQEHMMARRKILFEDGLMRWECQCLQSQEELAHGVEASKTIQSQLREMLAGFPALESLSNIINEYNDLDLRYDEDALPGISGLLSVLSRSFMGGFLYGIPETFFDQALGWTTCVHDGNVLTRRTTSDRPSHLKFTAGLPSWSWIGWKGPAWVRHDTVCLNSQDTLVSETFPITQWFTGSSPHTRPQDRRKIRSTWYEQRSDWKKSAQDGISPLPTGWTRQEHQPESMDAPLLWPTQCGRFLYKHRSLSGDDSDSRKKNMFFYPFPVPDITETTRPDMPEQTAYLFCTTQRARVWTRGDKAVVPDGSHSSKLLICIHGGFNVTIGTLQLHDGDQLRRLLDASAGTELGVSIELVAINRMWTSGNTFIEGEGRWGLPQWIRDFYTVLWIEWEGGVAYRKAIGWIEKSKWEQLDLEDVDLVLG